MHRKVLFLLIVWLAALAACAPVGDDATDLPTTTEDTTTPTRPESTPPNAELAPTTAPIEAMPILPVDNPLVQSAVDDLAARLGLRSSDIEVVRAEPVIWSDGSLGCPQPDMMYTQALVDGVFIQLRAGDQLYSYHGGGSQEPALCEGSAPVAPGQLPPGATGSGNS